MNEPQKHAEQKKLYIKGYTVRFHIDEVLEKAKLIYGIRN